jgi:TonB-dependent receptor
LKAFLTRALAIIASFLPSLAYSQTDPHGVVIGTVLNAATGNFLAGAVVSLDDTAISDVTDRTGRFQLSRVPAGTHRLRVIYPGLDAGVSTVAVGSGQTTVPPIALTSEVYQLQQFVVAGIREGNAQAIALQRQAPNLKTVVAIDAFGELADGNLGEFLKRLPGVGTGGSIDEVTTVRVRGASASHTAVTLDGTRMPSPGGQKTEREFEVDKLPADFIESIEVVKAPTPDMDADAIGGTVNLVSRSAFDTKGRYFSYRAGVTHQTQFENTGPFGNFQYSEALGQERKMGVFLTLNYSETFRDRDSAASFYGGPPEGPNPTWRVRFQPDKRSRERLGGGLKFDYRFSDTSSAFVTVMFNDYTQDNRAREYTVEVREARAQPGTDTRDLRMPSDNLRSEYTSGREATQSNTILDTQRTWSFQVGGKSQWVDSGYKLDYAGTYAPANGHQDRWLFNLQTNRNLRSVVERENDLDYFPTVALVSGAGLLGDWNDPNINPSPFYRFGESEESVWSGQFNLTKTFAAAQPVVVKAGGRYRGQQLERRYYEDGRRNRTYDAPDWNIFKETAQTDSRPMFGIDRYAGLAIYADARAIYEYTQANPQYWQDTFSPQEIRESIQDNGSVREEVTAGYVQATTRWGRLQVLGGVRVEETKVQSTGWVYDRDEAGPPTGGSEQQLIDFYRSEWHEIDHSRKYRNWFPGVHFRYEFMPNLLARASYSGAIGRPDFARLIPKTSINDSVSEDGDPAQSIRMNNVGLLPQESENLDLSLEYYFEPVGSLSAAVFQKDIKNFIYSIETSLTPTLLQQFGLDPRYEGWSFRSEGNRGQGKIQGYELAYSQHLGRFGRWLKGFSVYANYTHVISEGDLTDIIADVWNFGVAYEQTPWTVRFHLNYNGDYQSSFSENRWENDFRESELNGEVSLSYRFAPWLSVFANATNIFKEDLRTNSGGPLANGRVLANEVQDIGQRVIVGVSGRF